MSFKIYTKTGDTGETALIGGARVPKFHLRIEAYGTVDELNSYLGLIRDQLPAGNETITLLDVQDRLFVIGSELGTDPGGTKMKLPELKAGDIQKLELEIDRMSETLPALKNFILPGGNVIASHCHVARCICRRAERLVVHLNTQNPVPELILPFLNRLSDYLFVLSRFIIHQNGGEEINWTPEK